MTPSSAGDNQEGVLPGRDAGNHVVHEPVVPGHVDETDAPVADIGVGESQVDG